MGTSAHCHKRIAKVAKECCAATYDELMSSSNLLYETWKKKNPGLEGNRLRQHFVNSKWGMFVEAARATLACLLREPIDEKTKLEIVEILAMDSTLIRGRVNPARVAGQIVNKQ